MRVERTKEVFTHARALVDTGSTKCMVPKVDNDKTFHLEKAGRDKGVSTALGKADYDWVIIPRISLMREKQTYIGPFLVTYDLEETGLALENVETWLGDEYIVGMNFMDKFDVTLTKDGHIISKK